jgi:Domain of unknown function (DU1801)
MTKDDPEILQMLSRFSPALQATATELRAWIWGLYPQANELIYDKKNAFATGWGVSDKASDLFVSFAIYSKHINLGFTHGNLLPDPRKLLMGDCVQYRHYRMETFDQLPIDYFEQLLHQSHVNGLAMLKPSKTTFEGQVFVKQRREADGE